MEEDVYFEAILKERILTIKRVLLDENDIDDFYISFSGGKDSTVLHYLIDLAVPGNKIPRVYCNTGIEYNEVFNFVKELSKDDNRFIIINNHYNIREVLEKYGYPFKSKEHSAKLNFFQKNHVLSDNIKQYLKIDKTKKGFISLHSCPNILKYQFTDDFNLKVSSKCCRYIKEKPLKEWQLKNNKNISILGLMASEGGGRRNTKCFTYQNNKFVSFQPLAPLNKKWEQWFIEKYNIKLCILYYSPYNFERTGCKGCPFNIYIQRELDTLEKHFPKERIQCEKIFGKVYNEYRRLGYRNMRSLDVGAQYNIFDYLGE